jgi:hypothetical protein
MLYLRGAPSFDVPNEFDIPECDTCHEQYLSPEIEAALLPILQEEFVQWQSQHLGTIVSHLTSRHALSKAQLAGICGITPSHLSHLLNPASSSDSKASITLLRLFECFMACPGEVERHIGGKDFDIFSLFPCDVSSWSLPGDNLPPGQMRVPRNNLWNDRHELPSIQLAANDRTRSG